jgi:predicted ArsR family transcriptional regulator
MSSSKQKTWTFLTNHAQVLLCFAEDPDIRLRDVAERVGITERATQRILAELVEAGYVKTTRVGRRNTYTVDREHAMRHSAQFGYEIGILLEALTDGRSVKRSRGRPGRPRRTRDSR